MNKILEKKTYIFFLLAIILGFITSFSFSPYNYIFINFLTLPIFLYTLILAKKINLNSKLFFLIGWFFGFGYFLSGLYWISISLTYEESFKYLIPFTTILIPAFLAIFYGISTMILRRFAFKKISFVLIFSLIFSILEFLRGNILSGFPWNLLAYSWLPYLEVIQIISIIGTYSFNLISITIFSMPLIFFVNKKYKEKRGYWFISFLTFIFILNYFFGSTVLSKFDKSSLEEHDFILKIISPSIKLKEFVNGENNDVILHKLIKLSDPQPDKKTIFIWPEGMFPRMYLEDINKFRDIFSNKFSNLHLIVIGINKAEYIEKGNINSEIKKVYNTLAIIDNDTNLVSLYKKNKLVPFGEFLQLENFLGKLGLKTISFGYKSFSKGVERKVININNKFFDLKILPLICYEIIFPGKINIENKKTNLIINISEDGWFGDSSGPHQHFDNVIFRAIEQGNFIARSANNGISAFVDPKGRIIKKLQPIDAGVITTSLPIYEEKTIFSQYGNKLFFIIILLYIFLIFYFIKVEINEEKKLSFYK